MIDAAAAFKNHELTIVRDDGLYRHLRCQAPDTWSYGFIVVTWPGHLYVGGDIDGFTFNRIADMFEFFGDGRINPYYWAEKLTNRRQSFEKFDPTSARRQAIEHVAGIGLSPAEQIAMRWEIMNTARDFEHAIEAHEWLRDFEWNGYSFSDTWEWNLNELDPHYVLSCEAIVWAIKAYRAATSNLPQEARDDARLPGPELRGTGTRQASSRQWSDREISDYLNCHPEVRWDRFIEDVDGEPGAIAVYGWIDRPDGRADFVLYRFAPSSNDAYFTTSSVEFSAENGDEEHADCQRVADRFASVKRVTSNNKAAPHG